MLHISGITSLLRLSVLGLLWLGCAILAGFAQSYPNKTIRFIMPYPVGGSIDIAGRMVMQKLAENLGQQVVVDNRTGAGGIVGTEMAARSAADGYTLVMGGNGTLALSPHLQRNLPYDPVRDFAPVTQLVIVPYVLVVNPALKANSVGELIALARSRPDQINYASGGNGSAPHLAAELFKRMADVRLLHVPYKGSTPGINDVISGQVQLTFTGIPSVLSQIKSGRLRPLSRYERQARRGAAERAYDRRIGRSRLRGQPVVWRSGSGANAARARYAAQQRDRESPAESGDPRAVCG